jgi:O-antigen ligase
MHNTYLQFGAERGIPALLALLWLLGKMVFDLWRARRLHPGDWVIEASLGAMLAVPAAGWWEHNLGNGEVLPLFLAAVACGYVSARDLA